MSPFFNGMDGSFARQVGENVTAVDTISSIHLPEAESSLLKLMERSMMERKSSVLWFALLAPLLLLRTLPVAGEQHGGH